MIGFDTGNDALNRALDELRRWAECPERGTGIDIIEAVCDVLDAAERSPDHHDVGGCGHCEPRASTPQIEATTP